MIYLIRALGIGTNLTVDHEILVIFSILRMAKSALKSFVRNPTDKVHYKVQGLATYPFSDKALNVPKVGSTMYVSTQRFLKYYLCVHADSAGSCCTANLGKVKWNKAKLDW